MKENKSIERFWRLMPRLYYSTRVFVLKGGSEVGMKESMPRFLDYVYLNDGCIQREICEEFSTNASTVSKCLTTLAKEGFVHRRRSSQSAREVNVYITDKGRETEQRMWKVYEDMEDIIFQGFSKKEKEQFVSCMLRLTQNMMAYNKEQID